MSKPETCVCCGRVIPEGSQVCVICGMEKPKKKRQIDRIRNMSVKEMAWFMVEQVMQQECVHLEKENPNITATHIEFLKHTLFKGYLRYLESEVDAE